jgi:hypothetical protein
MKLEDFSRTVAALTVNVDHGHGKISYGPLDESIAAQLIAHHTQLNGLDAEAQGLIKPEINKMDRARSKTLGLDSCQRCFCAAL